MQLTKLGTYTTTSIIKITTRLLKIPPEYICVILFGTIAVSLHIYYGVGFTFRKWSFIFAMAAIMLIVAVNSVTSIIRYILGKNITLQGYIKNTFQAVTDWFSFVLLIFIYENLHEITYLISPNTLDNILMYIDELIFKVQPTIWVEKYSHPILIDYMAFAYALWLVPPLGLQLLFYYKNMMIDFKAIMLAQLLCFYIGFIGYTFVPAIGPKYILINEYVVPEIKGLYIQPKTHYVIDKLELIKRDCFPSLHTAISAVALFFIIKRYRNLPFGRSILIFCGIICPSIWASTIILREHWVIDIFAGLILALFSFYFSYWVINFWNRKGQKTYEKLY